MTMLIQASSERESQTRRKTPLSRQRGWGEQIHDRKGVRDWRHREAAPARMD